MKAYALAALAATPQAAPKTALTDARIHEIARDNGMYEQHDNARPSADTVEGFARAIEAATAPNVQLVEALRDIAESCNCCGDRHDLAQIAADALAAAGIASLPPGKDGD